MTEFTTTYTQTDECEPVFTIIFKTDDEEMYKKVQKLCRDMADISNISKLRAASESIRDQIRGNELMSSVITGGRHA